MTIILLIIRKQKVYLKDFRKYSFFYQSLFCLIEHLPPISEQYNETTNGPIVPRLDLPTEPPSGPPARISPREQVLNMMAEKKRQKWMRERGKH